MSQSSLNLTARDFDAYAPDKATSNVWSRPRIEVKQRALAWARDVVARLAELGIAADVHASDEHPSLRNKKRVDCQWVFFWRDEKARDELDRLLDQGRSISQVIDDPSPYTRHAFLALRVDAGGVEVCFAVHPEAKVDVENLRARLAQGEGALTDELMRALAALPEEFAIGVAPEDRVAASAATPEAIRSMIERAAGGQVPLWIGWRVPREATLEHGALVDEQLEDAIVALGPIYKLVAWSRANDHIALDRRLEDATRERARTHAEAEAQNERWRAEQEEARRVAQEQARARSEEARWTAPATPRPGAARPTLATLFKDKPRDDKPRSAPSASAPRADRAERTDAPQKPAEAPKPRAPEAARPASSGAFEKGARVCVRAGAFAGRVGVIGELDGKGGARVMLGLLSTRIELSDLEPVIEGRDRPTLQSSHRRPFLTPTRGAPASPGPQPGAGESPLKPR